MRLCSVLRDYHNKAAAFLDLIVDAMATDDGHEGRLRQSLARLRDLSDS
jgi:hypothetical protein